MASDPFRSTGNPRPLDDFDLGRALVSVVCEEQSAAACDPLFAEVLGRNMRAPLTKAAKVVAELAEAVRELRVESEGLG